MEDQWFPKVFSVEAGQFEELALEIFLFQYRQNSIYRAYVDLLNVRPERVQQIVDIPFLPIQFFKTKEVKTTQFEPAAVFESSGTTQTTPSRHFVKDLGWYRESFFTGFQLSYGSIKDWCILGLLPSYLERKGSSLVMMVDELIRASDHPHSGFYLYDHEQLYQRLVELENAGQKTLLIGVSFALLDFAEQYQLELKHTVVMETGGMKGRKKEMVRAELHEILKRKFSLAHIHSEYGMTELLSQAYSSGEGFFHCPPWMKMMVRDEESPLDLILPAVDGPTAQTGVMNIIDLANVYSCSFISTDDAGKIYGDGRFEIIGRLDNSDVRGCSLLLL